jgi:hypothetical protein
MTERAKLSLTQEQVRALYRAAVQKRNAIRDSETPEFEDGPLLDMVIPRLADIGWPAEPEGRVTADPEQTDPLVENIELHQQLERQWWANHVEHCDTEWPHPSGHECFWPRPAALDSPQDFEYPFRLARAARR